MLYISVVTPLKKYDFLNESNSHYFMKLIDKWGCLDMALNKHRLLSVVPSLCTNMFGIGITSQLMRRLYMFVNSFKEWSQN